LLSKYEVLTSKRLWKSSALSMDIFINSFLGKRRFIMRSFKVFAGATANQAASKIYGRILPEWPRFVST
jgi:hypothetical protein